MEAFVKLNQLQHARALREYAQRIRQERVDKGFPEWTEQEQLHDRRGVYNSILTGQKVSWIELLRNVTQAEVYNSISKGSPEAEEAPYISVFVFNLLSVYSHPGTQLTAMAYDEANDLGFSWKKQYDAHHNLHLTLRDASLPGENVTSTNGSPLILKAEFPLALFPNGSPRTGQALVVAVVLILLLFGVLKFAVRRIFLLDCDHFETLGQNSPSPQRLTALWLLTKPAVQDLNDLLANTTAKVIDLLQISGPNACLQLATQPAYPLIIIDHLECCLSDPEWRTALLSLVESLAFRRFGTVVLLTAVDPLHFLAQELESRTGTSYTNSSPSLRRVQRNISLHESETTTSSLAQRTGGGEQQAETFERWTRIFAYFSKKRMALPADLPMSHIGKQPSPLAQILMAKIAESALFSSPTEDEIEARFWSIWSLCTKAEKLALRQLAEEGFVNPNNRDILCDLGQRLLIHRGPAFQLPHKRFRQFVLHAESPQTIARWEGEGTTSGWTRLRVPFFLVLIGIFIFFLSTQRELYTTTVGLVTAAATLVPVILQLLGLLGGQRQGTSTG